MTSSASNGENKSLFERVEHPEGELPEDYPEGLMVDVPPEARQGLAKIGEEFARAEVEVLRNTIVRMRPIYAGRAAYVSSTPAVQSEFWRRVFAGAPNHVDSYVLPSDAEILGQSLRTMTVERFEVDENGAGEPRSVRLILEFDPEENKWFNGDKIVKDFYWRKEVKKTKNGNRLSWEGLVSSPVRIPWKEGMDPTKGLLDAACDLADAEEKAKAGDAKLSLEKRKALPAFETLVQKVSKLQVDEEGGDSDEDGEEPMTVQSPAGMSFFALFGYRGKDLTAEESKAAAKSDNERFEKMLKGEEVDLSDDEDDDEDFYDDEWLEDAEIFPDGEELATAICDDLWPNAHKYYEQSFDVADDFDSDMDLADLVGLHGEDDDDEEGGEDDEEAPPRKKART
ncbi:hypothetical protein FQN54_009740 [Arachnomyces sp. PD_36]|nr:hypothetical protein FQN54_009740 [Arachnomyces sp. PD_36]